MRITAAETVNFPDLARMAYDVSFEGSVRCVLEALVTEGSAPRPDARQTAERFVQLALQPLSFQAAFSGEFEGLRDRCASDVEDALIVLEARGWLRD